VSWDEKAREYAESRTYEHLPPGENSRHAVGVVRGARWQREALLSDETIERAARTMCWQANEWEDGQAVWETPEQIAEEIGEWVPLARAALTAAIGDDDE